MTTGPYSLQTTRPAGQAQTTALATQQTAPIQQSSLDTLVSDIRIWKMATVILGVTATYFVAKSWWRGRTVKKVRRQLSGAQNDLKDRQSAIEAARHALK